MCQEKASGAPLIHVCSAGAGQPWPQTDLFSFLHLGFPDWISQLVATLTKYLRQSASEEEICVAHSFGVDSVEALGGEASWKVISSWGHHSQKRLSLVSQSRLVQRTGYWKGALRLP